MKKAMPIIVFFLGLFFSSATNASEFKLYPGAKLDEKATKSANEMLQQAKEKDAKATIYTTADSFQKVTSFYKNMAQEYSMPNASGTSGKPRKLSGKEKRDLWEAYFIFDGAKDLQASKLWVKVQRPHVGLEIQDVTSILVKEKK